MERIRYLGKLVDTNDDDSHIFTAFQDFLDTYDLDNETGTYNPDVIMRRLSPQCDEMLLKCYWKSIETPCMINNTMIESRRTQHGWCCTFNYMRVNLKQQ